MAEGRRQRSAHAARLLGSSVVTVLGSQAVDMPDGYLGAADSMTTFALGYAGFLLLASVLLGWALLAGRGWARPITAALFSLNLGLFVPAFDADAVVAGLIVSWHLVLVLRQFFFAEVSEGRERRNAALPAVGWSARADEACARWGPAARHLLAVAFVSTVGVVGYRLTQTPLARLVCLGFDLVAVGVSAPLLVLLFRAGRRVPAVGAALLAGAPFFVSAPSVAFTFLAAYQVIALYLLVSQESVFDELTRFFFARPALLAGLTFVVLILGGTLALSFPAASASGLPIAPIDALFTSTSATCVTGLIVLDTPVDLSPFGHVVVLVLIQVGGLGILVLSTFATILLGERLGLRGCLALARTLETRGPGAAFRLTRFIVLATLVIEAVGGLLLAPSFSRHGLSFGESLWRGLFHAVSAFCNAGFALQSDSLMLFQDDPFALAVVAILITLGGIGFLVLATSLSVVARRGPERLDLQTKMVLFTSLALVVVGFVAILGVEWDGSLSAFDVDGKLTHAMFQSVTLRTAGFNSVDMGQLERGTVLLMQVLMFIGASPGGTGGGIKTTTLLVMLASVRAIARGRSDVELFRRRVPRDVVYRSLAITFVSLAVAVLALFVLLLSQNQSFEALAFEVTSALGTVGLSLGATPLLDPLGKLIIVLVMFVGRLGPLTTALVFGRVRDSRASYPDARVMVG